MDVILHRGGKRERRTDSKNNKALVMDEKISKSVKVEKVVLDPPVVSVSCRLLTK